jgi:uncharacterized protein YdhG (YjbR/CyaY superfamily)
MPRKPERTKAAKPTTIDEYAFRLDGAVVAGFAATAKGCSYLPFSGSTLATLAADLEGYDRTKGALHFHPDAPLPKGLVRKLIEARIAETR